MSGLVHSGASAFVPTEQAANPAVERFAAELVALVNRHAVGLSSDQIITVLECALDEAYEQACENLRPSAAGALLKALLPFANLGLTSGPDDEPCPIPYRILRGSIRSAREACNQATGAT